MENEGLEMEGQNGGKLATYPQFLYWNPNPLTVTVFGDKVFKEEVKVKWSH